MCRVRRVPHLRRPWSDHHRAATGSVPRPPGSRPAEQSALARLAGWCHDHRWWVLVAWIVGLVAVNVLAQSSGSNFTNNLSGGTQSAQQILNTRVPGAHRAARPRWSSPPRRRSPTRPTRPGPASWSPALDAPGPRVLGHQPVRSPEGAVQISTDGHIGYVRVNFDESAGNLPTVAVQKVIDTAQSFQAPGYHVALGGEAIDLVAGAKPGPERGHRHPGRHHHHAPGLRVGGGHGPAHHHRPVRYRRRLRRARPALPRRDDADVRPRDHGHDRARRRHRLRPVRGHPLPAGPGRGTRPTRRGRRSRWPPPGGPCVFAGTTVILSLLGLFLLQLPFMRGLAIGAIAAVVLVMLAAITLLPAMLGFSGRAIDKLAIQAPPAERRRADERGFWYRWSRTVQRHPLVSGLAAVLDPGLPRPADVLDAPGLHRRGQRPGHHRPPGRHSTPWPPGFGPGFNGPLVVAAKVPPGEQDRGRPARRRSPDHPRDRLRLPGRVQPVGHGRR